MSTDKMTEPGLETPRSDPSAFRRSKEALGTVLLWLVLTLVLSLLPAATGHLLWSWALGLDPLQRTEADDDVLVQRFRETGPGTGQLAHLATDLVRRDLSGHWTFAGGCGRLAVDRGVDFHGDTSFESLFAEHGFTLAKTEKLQPATSQESASPAFNALEQTWYPPVVAGMFLAIGLVLRRNLEPGAPLPRTRLPFSTTFGFGLLLAVGLLASDLPIDPVIEVGRGHLPLPPLDLTPVGLALVDSFPFAFVLLVGLLMIVAEECFFRGWAFEHLERQGGTTLAYAGSAGLWAMVASDSVPFAPLALAGLVLAWAYRQWGSLVVPIVARGVIYIASLLLPTLSTPPS